MSYLLAIESSTKALSIALFKDQTLLEEIFESPDASKTHSERLLPLIDRLLTSHKVSVDQLSSIAIAVGPGAFTSLRVGMATVLGLIEKRNIPLLPVSTLRALTQGAGKDLSEPVAVVIPAGRGRVYGAVYGPQGDALLPDALLELVPFLEKIQGLQFSPQSISGPAAELFKNLSSLKLLEIQPRASWVAQSAFKNPPLPMTQEAITIRYLQSPDFGGKGGQAELA